MRKQENTFLAMENKISRVQNSRSTEEWIKVLTEDLKRTGMIREGEEELHRESILKDAKVYQSASNRQRREQKALKNEGLPEAWLPNLVSSLNRGRKENPSTGEHRTPKALLLLVKRFQALESLADEQAARFQSLIHAEQGAFFRNFDNSSVANVAAKINRLLSRYAALPDLNAHIGRPLNQWNMNWLPLDSKRVDFHDQQMILKVIDIALAGRISSIKQCDDCRKWLIARFPHQRFCSEECKEHFHRSNEADKKRRRDWARNNYQTRKILETGSKNAK
jgi:predicted nucleic acid-binding Zn ribbon protein